MTLNRMIVPRVPPTRGDAGSVNDGIVVGLENLGETIKTQQALVRSCGAGDAAHDLAVQLNGLLRLLICLRRQQRALLRLWRSLPPGARVPPELVADTDFLIESHDRLEVPLRRCRSAALRRQREESVEAWREIAQLAQRQLAPNAQGGSAISQFRS